MNVIIETGGGLTDSNTYVGTDEAKAFAKARGWSLPCDNENIQALMFRAMDYIETFSHQFTGSRVSETQALSWPRECAYVAGELIDTDVIPKQLKLAVMYAMVAYNDGLDPTSNKSGEPFITRESVDVLRIDYAVDSQYNRDRLPMVDKLIQQLCNRNSMIDFVKA